MTTEHIEGLDDIEELVGRIGPRVSARRSAIKKERDGRKRHEANMALGAAAAIQRSRDKRAMLDEEDDQLNNISHMAGALLDAAEGHVEDDDDHEDDTPAAPAVVGPPPPPPAAGQPTEVVPIVEEEELHPLDVRNWDHVEWFWALFGALVGLVVARYTWHPFLSDIHGAGRTVLAVFWWIGLIILGFGLGGYLSFRYRWRHWEREAEEPDEA